MKLQEVVEAIQLHAPEKIQLAADYFHDCIDVYEDGTLKFAITRREIDNQSNIDGIRHLLTERLNQK